MFAALGLIPKGLIDALLTAKKLGVRIKIAGKAGPSEYIIRKFKEKGVKVEYLGLLSRSELIKRMSEADLFLYPSYFDAFPLILVEAINVGVPTVTYANPAYSWFYKNLLPQAPLGHINTLIKLSERVMTEPESVRDKYIKFSVPEAMKSWDGVLKSEWKLIKETLERRSLLY